MSVTLTVLDRAGDFRMADFYELVNSYLDSGGNRYYTRDELFQSSTIVSSETSGGAFFGSIDPNVGPGVFSLFALIVDSENIPVTSFATLNAAIDSGMTGTQAVAAVLSGDDTIAGARHADELWGFAGADRMLGFAGDDILRGGTGGDRLQGDRGDDQLQGGAGRDRFVYADIDGTNPGGWGKDVILDFEQGRDKIEFLDTHGVHRFSDLTITARQDDALIATGGGETITLKGIDAATLTAKDFAFAHTPPTVALDVQPGSAAHPHWIDHAALSQGLFSLA